MRGVSLVCCCPGVHGTLSYADVRRWETRQRSRFTVPSRVASVEFRTDSSELPFSLEFDRFPVVWMSPSAQYFQIELDLEISSRENWTRVVPSRLGTTSVRTFTSAPLGIHGASDEMSGLHRFEFSLVGKDLGFPSIPSTCTRESCVLLRRNTRGTQSTDKHTNKQPYEYSGGNSPEFKVCATFRLK